MLQLFAITIFLGATLLFLVQPIAAKLILPLLGGSPAVWNSCVLFFQAALLAGYCLAHGLGKLRPRLQTTLYAAALAAPIIVSIALSRLIIVAPTATPPPTDGTPIPWLLTALALMVGFPFLVVSAAGPLLQRWFSATNHPSAKDPYFLYAASNAGSMLGLLGYPFLVEPWLTLTEQRRLWSIAFTAFAILVALCGAVLMRQAASPVATPKAAPTPPAPATTWKARAFWLLLAFIPSSLTLGVTQHLSTDIAAVPLLWVVPLSLYLLTFILAFSRLPIRPQSISRILPLLILGIALLALLNPASPPIAVITLHLLTLFLSALLCHTRLAQSRPDPSRLTEFYLIIAAGGVLGGIFNALLAPVLFTSVLEYPIALILVLLVRPGRESAPPTPGSIALALAIPAFVIASLLATGPLAQRLGITDHNTLLIASVIIPTLACLAVIRFPVTFALSIAALFAATAVLATQELGNLPRVRTFFGLHRLAVDSYFHTLIHNTTTHGLQSRDPLKKHIPLGYYHTSSPIGQVFETFNSTSLFDRIGLVGLGTGALAAYGREGQHFTFHEIDPAIVKIAENPAYFTYLRDSKAKYSTILGDGRLTIARVPDSSYGLILLDAFSSDAIPVHLITREAVALYLTKLAPRGLIAFHISNHYLNLGPVLSRNAEALGLTMLWRKDEFKDPKLAQEMDDQGIFGTSWVLLARDPADFGPLLNDPRWRKTTPGPSAPLWTDDYSNILSIFHWK